MRSVVWIVVVIAGMFFPTLGHARADESVVVLPLRSLGEEPLAAASQQRLRNSLQGGLAAAQLTPVDAEPSLVRAPSLRGCDTTACLGRLAELAGAPLVLLSSVEVVGSSNFTFTLELFSQKRAQRIARTVERCEICNASEANEALSHAVEQLAVDAVKKLATNAPAVAANHHLAPNATSTAGMPILVRPAARPLVLAAVSLGVVGVFALAGGATLLALDGHHHDSTSGTPILASPQYHTATSGGVVVGLGAAAVVSAAMLGWWSTVSPLRTAPTQALVLPTGNGATFVMKF